MKSSHSLKTMDFGLPRAKDDTVLTIADGKKENRQRSQRKGLPRIMGSVRMGRPRKSGHNKKACGDFDFPRKAMSKKMSMYRAEEFSIWARDTKKPEAGASGFCIRFGDSYGIRTREPAVRGRCLNHLTKEPFIILHGFSENVKGFLIFPSLFPCALWIRPGPKDTAAR